MSKEIRIGVIGRPNSGKSTFIKRITVGQFYREYKPTYGLEQTPLNYKLLVRNVPVNINIKLVECRKIVERYDALIIFIDEDESPTENIKYFDELPKLDNTPIVICSVKGDERNRSWYGGNKRNGVVATLCHKRGYYVLQISSLSNYNIEKPIIYLIRKLMNTEDVVYDC